MGSADLMPRNLDGRVETLFPVENRELLAALRDDVLGRLLGDPKKARRLRADGRYERVEPGEGEGSLNSQKRLLQKGGGWHLDE